jgi:hypothetical protein
MLCYDLLELNYSTGANMMHVDSLEMSDPIPDHSDGDQIYFQLGEEMMIGIYREHNGIFEITDIRPLNATLH